MGIAYVIGLGKSGLAAARLLRAQGYEVVLSDRNDSEALRQQQQALAQVGITVRLGDNFHPGSLPASLDSPSLVVVSPGVPWDTPGLVAARQRGWDMVGELGYAWRQLQDYPWLCVTGTNGKTTTTALINAMFKQANFPLEACGNIGYPACEVAYQVRYGPQGCPSPTPSPTPSPNRTDGEKPWILAELSSYQIEAGWDVVPRIAVWTTLTPDHLSRHRTVENYAAIKARLLHQAQVQVLNGDDAYLRQHGPSLYPAEHYPQVHWTSTAGPGGLLCPVERGIYLENGWVWVAGEAIVAAASLPMDGSHNQQNLLMAVGAAKLAGVKTEAIAQAIQAFPGVPHRLERLGQWHGISFVNDSKATNYDAAEVGLQAMTGPTLLIAGGEPKEGDDRGWLAQIQARASAVILVGAAAESFAARLEEVGYGPVAVLPGLAEAVPRAAQWAEALGAKAVLLSPACASFDQYPNFEARGDHFRQLCQDWIAKQQPKPNR